MRLHAVQTAGSGDLATLGDAARDGRAAAMQRRRQLSQGKQALNGAGAPPAAENLHADGAGAPPAARNGQGGPSGGQGAPAGKAVATDGVAEAHLGRALSVQRRRQLARGKQALSADGDRTAAAAGADAPAFIVLRGGAR